MVIGGNVFSWTADRAANFAVLVANDIGVTPYYGLASGFLTGKYGSTDDLTKSVRGGR